jgi:hypothetical protein
LVFVLLRLERHVSRLSFETNFKSSSGRIAIGFAGPDLRVVDDGLV